MYFQYGSYRHPANEVTVRSFQATRLYNSRGRAQIIRRRMQIEGEIIATSQAAINNRVAELKMVYALAGGDAILLTDAGAATGWTLSSAASISGVRIVDMTFLANDGVAHWATGLPFRVTFEADYIATDADNLTSYSETIRRVGRGMPRRLVIEVDNDDPVEQFVSSATPIVIQQSGRAVGIGSWPVPNPPIFPAYLDSPDGDVVEEETPRLNGYTWLDYPVSWNYSMTLTKSTGIPHPLLRGVGQ